MLFGNKRRIKFCTVPKMNRLVIDTDRNRRIIISQKSGQFRWRFIRNVSQPGVCPCIGTIKHYHLIAGVKDNVSRLCGNSLIIARKALTDETYLLKTSVQ